MTILLVGGGSGGHITPVLAVAEALKKRQPSVRLIYVIGKGDRLRDIPRQHPAIDGVVTVRAGKFRRYHGEGWRQFLDLKTLFLNLRDAGYVFVGLWQSWRLLRRYRPAAIFIKGGFVGVPVGLIAGWLKVPYVTHDSDAIPGLANRIIAKQARKHAVAMPVEVYNYPKDRTVQVGVPVDKSFAAPSIQQQKAWREELGIDSKAPVVCLTGGGNGSELLNNTLIDLHEQLQTARPDLVTIHIAGRIHADKVRTAYGDEPRVQVLGFTNELYKYTGVADVIIARAGANSLADFARQERACIIIPNPLLTGGHQLKNAQVLADEQAIKVVDEADLRHEPTVLAAAILDLLEHPKQRQQLAAKLAEQARPQAASDLAGILLDTVGSQETSRGA